MLPSSVLFTADPLPLARKVTILKNRVCADFYAFEMTTAPLINWLNVKAKYGHTFDTQNFRFIINNLALLEANLQLRLVQLV